MIQGSHNCDY